MFDVRVGRSPGSDGELGGTKYIWKRKREERVQLEKRRKRIAGLLVVVFIGPIIAITTYSWLLPVG